MAHANDQLSRAGKNLDQVAEMIGSQRMELESLEQAYADTDPEKVVAPMPIPETE